MRVLLPGALCEGPVARCFMYGSCCQVLYVRVLLPGALSEGPVARCFK